MTAIGDTFKDLYEEVCDFLGLSTSVTANVTLAKKLVNRGYANFLSPIDPRGNRGYLWSFLTPSTTIAIWPTVAVNASVTVTGASYTGGKTTVTATAASFYPSMVGRTIAITAVGLFTISDYTSSTVIKVSGNATGTTKTFSITPDGGYALPADFSSMRGNLTYDRNAVLSEVVPSSIDDIRRMYSGGGQFAGWPRYFAVEPMPFNTTDGQRYQLLLWPDASALYTLHYSYLATPAVMSADSDKPVGGGLFSNAILYACLAEAESRRNDAPGGSMHQRYKELLAAAIDMDARSKARSVGPMGHEPIGFERRLSVTYTTRS